MITSSNQFKNSPPAILTCSSIGMLPTEKQFEDKQSFIVTGRKLKGQDQIRRLQVSFPVLVYVPILVYYKSEQKNEREKETINTLFSSWGICPTQPHLNILFPTRGKSHKGAILGGNVTRRKR